MKLTGAQVLFEALQKENVDTIFGFPGGAVLDIFDELYRRKIRNILVRHEQGAIHAADGYARVSGKVGVCLVTSGPGATNTVTGIANAFMDSIPVVVLTGQVATSLIGGDAFQEVDITGITRPCTKHNFLVRRIDDLGRIVREAFDIARSGRPGPVLIDIPKDITRSLIEDSDVSWTSSLPNNNKKASIDDACVKALDMIRKAERPLIISGGGVLLGRAWDELRTFVKMLNVPITSTLMGLGAFPASDPHWLGMPGMHGTYYANMAISNCDLLIALGVRFDDRVTSKLDAFAPHAKVLHIDIDPASIDKFVKTHLSIASDCKPVLQLLNKWISDKSFAMPEKQTKAWLEQIQKWKKFAPMTYCQSDKIKPQYVVETLYRLTEGKAIISTEVGQNQMWAAQFYHFDYPNSFITSGGLGTMGYGFPAAIGAQGARPDKVVVDIAGDGSIQMNIQELATAVNYDLPVKIVILNNGFLGMVRQWQELFYGKRYSHSNISNVPDFVKLAEAYGAVGLRATRPEEVEATLRKGLDTAKTVIMDFHVEPEEGVYPMVSPGAAISDMVLSK
ncbi:MAG TPA: biosynthetic-type acetolactate synthase large subunit [Syntrophales bacterium]